MLLVHANERGLSWPVHFPSNLLPLPVVLTHTLVPKTARSRLPIGVEDAKISGIEGTSCYPLGLGLPRWHALLIISL